MALDRLRSSLAGSPVVKFGDYDYFVHPITDGLPLGDPAVLEEVADALVRLGDWTRCDKIVTAESMGFPLAAVLVIVATLTKVVGCAIPARAQGMTRNESLAVGWGMVPRGEVGLIIAATALAARVIGDGLFSVVVLVMVVVSIVPAPLFKRALDAVRRDREAAASAAPGPPAT